MPIQISKSFLYEPDQAADTLETEPDLVTFRLSINPKLTMSDAPSNAD